MGGSGGALPGRGVVARGSLARFVSILTPIPWLRPRHNFVKASSTRRLNPTKLCGSVGWLLGCGFAGGWCIFPEAYGFGRSALKLVHDYLFNRKQRVKVNGSYSTWQESIKGVPQGSVLGPLLFNVFLNDLFFLVEETEICNYADDTTIYVCGHELEQIVSSLETDAQKLSKWFLENGMKLNLDKCHLLIFGG